MPARNELQWSATASYVHALRQNVGDIRNAHYSAQGEQHEEAVPHGGGVGRKPWQMP